MNSTLGECMASRRTAVLVSVALLFAGIETSIGNAQETPAPVKAVQLIGLAGVKQNAKGTLQVDNGNLQFVHGKTSADITALSIQDVVTGDDTQRSVGGTVGVMSMAAPYGGGRFLSLFRRKIDTLTIRYCGVDGGLHGAIFTMPVGAANAIKTQLVSEGDHSATTGEPTTAIPSGNEQNATQSPEHPPGKIKASAIQVEMVQSDEIKLPAEFQIAFYENLVHQIEKQRTSQHIYRDGDRTAASVPDLVVLDSTVRGFRAGSERARQVTTVAGATSIRVHCQFTGSDAKPLLARDVNGKVRFFGGNLKATYDFAKKAARVTHENFSSPDGK
jgi:hypothetical protein